MQANLALLLVKYLYATFYAKLLPDSMSESSANYDCSAVVSDPVLPFKLYTLVETPLQKTLHTPLGLA